MKKINNIIIILAFLILFLLIPNICMAKDLDQINEYNITIDPRKNGSLDIVYTVKWQVLDSDSEGPLEWVKIGIPNSSVSSIKPKTKNIKSAKYYEDNGDYVRIDFKEKYYEGDIIEFSFSTLQDYMYLIKDDICVFEFTPGWFDDIEVKKINVLWNANNVYSSSSKNTNSDNYLVWSSSLRKGKKLTINVSYLKNVFNLNYSKQTSSAPKVRSYSNSNSSSYYLNMIKIIIVLIVVVYVASVFLGLGYRSHGGYGYRSHSYYESRDYDRGSSSFWSSSSHSSSSCVSSCACACACAGGGRAGCSKKDFYGTNLNIDKIKNVLGK